MKIGITVMVNEMAHILIYYFEGNSSNAAVLVPSQTNGAIPSFMAVKNIRQKEQAYLWDEVFYTEEMKSAYYRCEKWAKGEDGQS